MTKVAHVAESCGIPLAHGAKCGSKYQFFSLDIYKNLTHESKLFKILFYYCLFISE
jgi:hypothetical protein